MRKTLCFAAKFKGEYRLSVYILYLDEDEFEKFIDLLKTSQSIRGLCVDAAINTEFNLEEKNIREMNHPYIIYDVENKNIEFYNI